MDATDITLDPGAKALFDVLQDAVIVTDTLGRIIYWNGACERTFGYPKDEAVGQSLTLIMPTEHHCAFARGLDQHNRTGVPKMAGTTFSLNGRRRSGEEFPVQVALARWFVGSTPLFCGLIQDISELSANPRDANRINRLRLYQNHTAEAQCSQSRKALQKPLTHLMQCLDLSDHSLQQTLETTPALEQRWTAATHDAHAMNGVLHAVEEFSGVGELIQVHTHAIVLATQLAKAIHNPAADRGHGTSLWMAMLQDIAQHVRPHKAHVF
jgi:PAS domain S-box-containing protein